MENRYKLLNKILICLECRKEEAYFTFNLNDVTCNFCGHKYPILKGVLAAFDKKDERLIEFTEVLPEERENFLKRKRFAYSGKGVISELFNHYHVFGSEKRQSNKPSSFFFDIGCGMGEHGRFLKKMEVNNYVGIDLDNYKLGIFRESHPEALLIQSDARKLPFKNACTDYVQTMAFLEHFDDRGLISVLSEIKRVLKPGGTYINCMPAEGSYLLKASQKILNVIRYLTIGIKVDYSHVHKNSSGNIREHLLRLFKLRDSLYFPTQVSLTHLNWFINEVYINAKY